MNLVELVRSGGSVAHLETARLRKDGTPVEVSISMSPIRDAAGKIVALTSIAHNIASRKQAERDLHDQRDLDAE